MIHTCHAHGCTKTVSPRMFACLKHWRALPIKIQRAIWREYRRGQELDKEPSLRYLAVQRLAVAHTAFKPNDDGAACIAASYLQQAIVLAKECEEKGFGNPLDGLLDTNGRNAGASTPTEEDKS